MRAITYRKYGPPEVLEFEELPKPIPGPEEVLIKTHATTVTAGDWRARSLDLPPGFGLIGRLLFGIRGPRQKVLGGELAGVVEAIGGSVTTFRVGDRVFGFTGAKLGCYAAFCCLPERGNLIHIPDNLNFELAASLSFGGTTGLDFFRKAELKPNERVLINGASGGVGTAAVQLAKHHFGAHVTGVCSAKNAELVQSLGADQVIDYQQQDFTQHDETYDVIMDTVGTAPYAKSKHCLRPNGRLLLVMGSIGDLLRSPWISLTSQHRVIGGAAAERRDDLLILAELAANEKCLPVIDRSYPMEQIVAAHHYVDSGRKVGNVVVRWPA